MNLKRLLRSLATALAGTLVVFAIVIGAGLMLSGSSPDLSYRTLDYDVAVQADGSLKVTQHIDMKLRTRDGDTPWRQLYQKYTLREDGLTNITDISVRNVTAGENYEQGALASPADHSDTSWDREYAGHWYIADVTDGAENPQPFDPAKDGYEISDNTTSRRSKDVEIGWSIPATKKASSLKFDVTMTLHGGTTLYKDVASWQWEPFGDSNLIPIGKVTGIVRFPDGIDASSSWAWLHYAASPKPPGWTTARCVSARPMFAPGSISTWWRPTTPPRQASVRMAAGRCRVGAPADRPHVPAEAEAIRRPAGNRVAATAGRPGPCARGLVDRSSPRRIGAVRHRHGRGGAQLSRIPIPRRHRILA